MWVELKYVLLSADSDTSVYLVPDEVANNLKKYCIDFCNKWLYQSSYAKKYHIGGSVCYNEKDFIEYVNTWIFPNEPSVLIETIGWINSKADIPEKYRECKWFNF